MQRAVSFGGDKDEASIQEECSLSSTAVAPEKVGEPVPSSDILTLLKSIAETAAVFGYIASVTGWSYLSSYFSFFGFRPMELDVSSSLASLFAVSVLYQSALPLALSVAIVILVSLFRNKLPRFGEIGMLLVLLAATLTLYKLGSHMGRTAAKEDIWEETSNRLPSVGFFATESQEGFPSCVSATNPHVDCRLLFHAKSVYYFFKPFASAIPNAPPPSNLEVFALPESKVRLVQYQRGVQ